MHVLPSPLAKINMKNPNGNGEKEREKISIKNKPLQNYLEVIFFFEIFKFDPIFSQYGFLRSKIQKTRVLLGYAM